MSQNCAIIKILLHFGPVLCKITSLRTLFGGDILISGEKYVFKHVLLPRKVQKSSWFKILCSFHPFCPIQRVHLAIFFFWNITCLSLLFGVNYWFLGKYLSSNMLYYQERVQNAVGFWILCSLDLFCSIPMACLAIFWNYNMFKVNF